MSEFRGTKGKWVIDTEESYRNESGVLVTPISIENFIIGFVDVYGDQPEDRANALLISKSHEMFEMLKECMRVLSSVQSPATPSILLHRKIEQLIKEATEL